MVLPSSGPISLGQIQTEFGGSNPISISEYYNGGPYIVTGTPNGENDTAIAPNVPSSGPIKFSDFYGAAKLFDVTFSMSRSADNQNYFYFNSAVGIVTATLGFNGSGAITLKVVKNVSYQITSNPGTDIRLSGNTIELEDGVDTDYNDLRATPSQGTISQVGSNFYYLLT
jgi:hypothetical protein